MASENPDADPVTGERRPTETDITPQLVGLSMLSGLVGIVAMSPLLVGLPLFFGVFRAEPLAEFANIGSFFGLSPSLIGQIGGYDPNLVLGAFIFALGGILFLPVQFLVVASFLPPESPRFARGVTFAMLWWIGFVFAFWPGGSLAIGALFLALSSLSHFLYGLTLGYLVDRLADIPQHEV